MKTIIYHNPRCSKSRETLSLLQQSNIEAEIVEYLKTPLSAVQIAELIEKLKLSSARQLMRVKESIYKELELKSELSEQALIQAMVDHPKLIERPIVVNGQKAAIGRPPESVLDIF